MFQCFFDIAVDLVHSYSQVACTNIQRFLQGLKPHFLQKHGNLRIVAKSSFDALN